jgi:hypothetical protein
MASFACERCGAPMASVSRGPGSTQWMLLILGAFLCVCCFPIGIPVVIVTVVYMLKDEKAWYCTKCGAPAQPR